MTNLSVLNLGFFPKSQNATITIAGVTFPTSGTYSVEAYIDGKIVVASLVAVAGNNVAIANTYPSDANVVFRIKLPVADRTVSNNYINTSVGAIWFQFQNVQS